MDEVLAGVRLIRRTSVLLGAISLDLFAVLLGGAVALLPIFAKDILEVGPVGYGWMASAPAIGAILMSLAIMHRRPMAKAGQALLVAVAGFGVAIIVFGLSRSFALSFAALLMTGAFDCISVIVRSTTLQLSMPDHMRGRVAAVNNIFIGTSNELGAFESGFAANYLGLVPSVVFGGCVSIVTVIVAGLVAPKLRALDLQALSKAEAPSERGT